MDREHRDLDSRIERLVLLLARRHQRPAEGSSIPKP
jgi:hypothetical protein